LDLNFPGLQFTAYRWAKVFWQHILLGETFSTLKLAWERGLWFASSRGFTTSLAPGTFSASDSSQVSSSDSPFFISYPLASKCTHLICFPLFRKAFTKCLLCQLAINL